MSKEKELMEKVHVQKPEGLEGAQVQAKNLMEEDEEHHEESIDSDLSHYSKEDLIKLAESLKADEQPSRINTMLRQIKIHFDQIVDHERQEALQKFVENGGEEGDFEFRKDKTAQKFDKLYENLRDRISNHYNELEREKERNLRIKNELLDKLRFLLTQEENNASLNAFKEIQEEWKKTGPVPNAYNQDLWANYNALVERFYNNRSIYFELKELDRKKNLEAKKEIVDKAEQLAASDVPVSTMIRELKALHEEFRNIGPVPKEDQEQLWNRFKQTSDKIYEKRNEYQKNIKERQEENLSKKSALADKISAYAEFNTERIEEWKTKTQEVLALQEEWKALGGLPPEKGKDISKKFWGSCKTFFHHKEVFFKNLEVEKLENLKKKEQLCEKAEAVKDSEDFAGTASYLKVLQKEWEAIGPVPIKEKENIFRRFKAACDHFFNKKREVQAEADKEYVENLKKKEVVIEKIQSLIKEKNADASAIKELQEEWRSIGFVPKNKIKEINSKYSQAMDSLFQQLGGEDSNLKLSLQIEAMKTGPDGGKKLFHKEKEIQRKIGGLKAEIDRLKTNMEFFAKSAKADELKKEIQQKIEAAQDEVNTLTQQLKMVRAAE
ncbi:MAG: DUF349 domain-containing protein [Cytophagaceae bacterium]